MKSVPAPRRYYLKLRFAGSAAAAARMEVLNAIRELGAFRMRRGGNAQDVLELRTSLKQSELEKRLGELARLKRGFYCRIDECDGDKGRPGTPL
ncbi:MAG TPA: hypothetical protein PKK31_04315 [Elusimicrobiales bacterium]|nr:hypothetical protein [Elusimicrobiales bacterium]